MTAMPPSMEYPSVITKIRPPLFLIDVTPKAHNQSSKYRPTLFPTNKLFSQNENMLRTNSHDYSADEILLLILLQTP